MEKQINLEDVLNHLEDIQESSLEFLKEIVNIDGNTMDRAGVSLVAETICNKLFDFGIESHIVKNGNYGDCVVGRISGNKGNNKILLLGHLDTAHAPGTTKTLQFNKEGNVFRGPGVSDMKSGLVYMIYAANALKEYFPKEIPEIILLFTSDEELGSPESKRIIKKYANGVSAVFNLEPSRPDGTIVTSRKGSAHLKINIKGKAAHSGAFIEDGISANDELARKMIEIKNLSDPQKGLTINFGIIEGGTGNNIVSPTAKCSIHCSFWKTDDFNKLYKDIHKVVNRSYIEGTESSLTGEIGMYPMEENEENEKIYKVILDAAKILEQDDVVGKKTNGAADSGFTSSLGIPTICGMGPVGGNWHRRDEYLEIDSYLPRLKLLTTAILLLSKKL
jgi:glutamate carboxypeptidase